METAAQTASAKIARRLIPFLMLCYFVAYLDRLNLSFASALFKRDLGIGDAVYGFGAGIFFAGYFLFEVPSNIILERVGARLWIARIMFTWGLASAAMALITGEQSFYVVRFLLGIAEAGFFPGIILYMTYWYTAAERTRMIGLFMVAIPVSSAVGAPLSTAIMANMADVAGLKGWQWLFIIEAIPALILSVVTYFYLTDRPADAIWLTEEERNLVARRLDGEIRNREAIRKYKLGEALSNPRVLALSLIYFGIVTGLYGLGFWLPQIVRGFVNSEAWTTLAAVNSSVSSILKIFGNNDNFIGWVVAVPYIFSAVIMVPWTRHSDLTGERTWHIAIAAFLGGAGLIAGAYLKDPVLAMCALTVGSIGTFAALPSFWSLPTGLLTGTAAAGGIALINAIGNLGGFVGPYLKGWINETFDNPAAGTAAIGGFLILSSFVTVMIGHDRRMEQTQLSPAE